MLLCCRYLIVALAITGWPLWQPKETMVQPGSKLSKRCAYYGWYVSEFTNCNRHVGRCGSSGRELVMGSDSAGSHTICVEDFSITPRMTWVSDLTRRRTRLYICWWVPVIIRRKLVGTGGKQTSTGSAMEFHAISMTHKELQLFLNLAHWRDIQI